MQPHQGDITLYVKATNTKRSNYINQKIAWVKSDGQDKVSGIG